MDMNFGFETQFLSIHGYDFAIQINFIWFLDFSWGSQNQNLSIDSYKVGFKTKTQNHKPIKSRLWNPKLIPKDKFATHFIQFF